MNGFRALLGILLSTVVVYTGIVGTTHGWDLLPVFFGDIAVMAWPGQFNVDFSCFLCLSATWLAWRHHFSPAGLVLGFLGLVGGTLTLATYLIIASYAAKGDVEVLLLGARRARG